MLLETFPSGPLGANCYVLAPRESAECVVIDPGQQAMAPLREVLGRHRLRPAGVLVTHGHFDHVASAADACAEFHAPLYIGAGDEYMLDDPWSALSADLREGVAALLAPGEDFDHLRPATVIRLGMGPSATAGTQALPLAGLDIEVLSTPGHTPGSVVYRLTGQKERPDVLFTGDTLFAGSIGRTDLPGGSSPQILRSIAGALMTLADGTVVLPGHGPASTVGAERRGNPFLRHLAG